MPEKNSVYDKPSTSFHRFDKALGEEHQKLVLGKLLIIIGPTSSGKSELAIILAKKFNGEIISADSRQIYKGMNLGTGKVPGKWKAGRFIYKGVAHHLIDFASPKKTFSAALFQPRALKTIQLIQQRGRLPILCGGTGHWIDAVVYRQSLPDVPPHLTLRKKLDKLSAAQLFVRLKKLDPHRAATIDPHNKRRLIRALEIVITTGKPVPKLEHKTQFDMLWLGLSWPQTALYNKIDKRLAQRLRAGMVKEVRKLHDRGLSWKKLKNFGLEYKFIALFLQGKLTQEQMTQQLSYAIKHYAKRQLTWWKRNQGIVWLEANKKTSLGKSFQLTKKFILS